MIKSKLQPSCHCEFYDVQISAKVLERILYGDQLRYFESIVDVEVKFCPQCGKPYKEVE